MSYRCVSRAVMWARMWCRVAWTHVIWIFVGNVVDGSASEMDVSWYSVREFHLGWWLSSSNLERVNRRLFFKKGLPPARQLYQERTQGTRLFSVHFFWWEKNPGWKIRIFFCNLSRLFPLFGCKTTKVKDRWWRSHAWLSDSERIRTRQAIASFWECWWVCTQLVQLQFMLSKESNKTCKQTKNFLKKCTTGDYAWWSESTSRFPEEVHTEIVGRVRVTSVFSVWELALHARENGHFKCVCIYTRSHVFVRTHEHIHMTMYRYTCMVPASEEALFGHIMLIV